MPTTSLVDAASLLVVDVGAVNTRAILFDDVEGRYRYLASGIAPTTARSPFQNVSEGVHMAIDQLQKTTGRTMIGSNEELIIPSAGDGSGVDSFTAMVSAGPPLKVVVVGLLEDVSLESARHLITTTYGKIVQQFSLNDRRRPEARLNAIMRLRPDLIVIAGGTEGGASQSVLKLIESVGLACYLMPEGERPFVLFAGNSELQDEVKNTIGGFTTLCFAPNLRPALDVEQLEGAQAEIAKVYGQIRSRRILGVGDLENWARGRMVSPATGLGRIVRYISKVDDAKKGVLGIDVGASATTVAASFQGNLSMGVYPQLGLGEGLAELLDHIPISDISRWFTLEISDDYVREYLFNKAIYPASLPATPQDLEIEQAIARQVMQSALKLVMSRLPEQIETPGEGLLPWFEPIIATGSVLTHAPSLAQSALLLLDGLQPTGITSLILDQNHLASALGAAAAVNPILTAQVLDSNSLLHLATVITPIGNARPGTPVLRLKITYENDRETNIEVKQGSLEVIPLLYGQTARIHLHPLHHYDVGMGMPGRGGSLGGAHGLRGIKGSALGVIVDARGRPLALPHDLIRRKELVKSWLSELSGS